MRDVNIFLKGFRRFQHHYFDRNPELFDRLFEEGQRPRALMVACCDSRCDPVVLTDCKPGDLFVVRNVANLVPPHIQATSYAGTTSAIAFAICNLGVEHVIVMGHAKCGGIRALMQYDSDAGEFRVMDLHTEGGADHPDESLRPKRLFENWESNSPP